MGPKPKHPFHGFRPLQGWHKEAACPNHLWYSYGVTKTTTINGGHACDVPQIRPSFNRSLRLETRPELLSADTGALVQREMMDRSGLIDWLTGRLHDPRHPSSIRYPPDLLRTDSCCWGRAGATSPTHDRLRQDPSLRVASRPVGARRPWRRARGWRRNLVPTAGTLSRTFRSCTRR